MLDKKASEIQLSTITRFVTTNESKRNPLFPGSQFCTFWIIHWFEYLFFFLFTKSNLILRLLSYENIYYGNVQGRKTQFTHFHFRIFVYICLLSRNFRHQIIKIDLYSNIRTYNLLLCSCQSVFFLMFR